MTALAKNKEAPSKEGKILSFPVAASAHIYKGALVKIASGYLAPEAAGANEYFIGVAYEECDNSAGSAGDKSCKVELEGVFEVVASGMAQTDLGKSVYASDDQTVSTTQGSDQHLIGKIVEVVSATKLMVKI